MQYDWLEVGTRVYYTETGVHDTGVVVNIILRRKNPFSSSSSPYYEVKWDNADANDYYSREQLTVIQEDTK